MVKRYNPEIHTVYASKSYEETEYLAHMKINDSGKFVSYEAYRQLEKAFNQMKYGHTCEMLSRKLNISCEQLIKTVIDSRTATGHFPEYIEFNKSTVIRKDKFLKVLKKQ